MNDSNQPRFVGAAPWIACSDLKSTVKYYRDVLGFRGSWGWTWGDPPDHAGVGRGRTRLLFVQDADRAARSRGAEIVIYVIDVAAFYRELQVSQADIIQPLATRPWGTVDFTVEDPDGVHLVFTEAPEWNTAECDE